MIIRAEGLYEWGGQNVYRGTEAVRAPPRFPMSTRTPDRGETQAGDQERRFAELVIGDDEFVIYDRENHQAWIQSSVAMSLTEQR